MAACNFCKSTIIFGGISNGPHRYCNKTCLQRAMLALAADAVPEDIVAQTVQDVHQGPCPVCRGPGPVDVHTSYFVWSAVVLTGWKNTPGVSCRRCARKRQTGAALGSAVVGWWGFPWGLVMTPVQVGRNISAMVGGPHDARPSPSLQRMVKTQLGARVIAAEQQRLAQEQAGGAAPPTAPASR